MTVILIRDAWILNSVPDNTAPARPVLPVRSAKREAEAGGSAEVRSRDRSRSQVLASRVLAAAGNKALSSLARTADRGIRYQSGSGGPQATPASLHRSLQSPHSLQVWPLVALTCALRVDHGLP